MSSLINNGVDPPYGSILKRGGSGRSPLMTDFYTGSHEAYEFFYARDVLVSFKPFLKLNFKVIDGKILHGA